MQIDALFAEQLLSLATYPYYRAFAAPRNSTSPTCRDISVLAKNMGIFQIDPMTTKETTISTIWTRRPCERLLVVQLTRIHHLSHAGAARHRPTGRFTHSWSVPFLPGTAVHALFLRRDPSSSPKVENMVAEIIRKCALQHKNCIFSLPARRGRRGRGGGANLFIWPFC